MTGHPQDEARLRFGQTAYVAKTADGWRIGDGLGGWASGDTFEQACAALEQQRAEREQRRSEPRRGSGRFEALAIIASAMALGWFVAALVAAVMHH